MKYDKREIERLYQENLSAARQLLASLPVAEGRQPGTVTGLNGWVYEQTIRHCLFQELNELGIIPTVKEQVKLYGRAEVDLLVGGKVAIEIKASGIFPEDLQKYGPYRLKAEENGWSYFYVTGSDNRPCRVKTQSIFGEKRAFFLDTEGDWERFVGEIIRNLT